MMSKITHSRPRDRSSSSSSSSSGTIDDLSLSSELSNAGKTIISRFKSRVKLLSRRRTTSKTTVKSKNNIINNYEINYSLPCRKNNDADGGTIHTPADSLLISPTWSFSSSSSCDDSSINGLGLQQEEQDEIGTEPNRNEIPRNYVDTILQVYGVPSSVSAPSSVASSTVSVNSTTTKVVDLYRDVFHFSSEEISDREILMAYLRKGRDIFKETPDEILGTTTCKENRSSSNSSSSSSCSTNNQQKNKKTSDSNTNKKQRVVDPDTRLQFLALSMAYEILSTPSLKEIYLQQGGLSNKKNGNNNMIKKKKKTTTTTTIGTPATMDSSWSSTTTTRAMNLLTSQQEKKGGRIGRVQDGNSTSRPYSTALRKSSFTKVNCDDTNSTTSPSPSPPKSSSSSSPSPSPSPPLSSSSSSLPSSSAVEVTRSRSIQWKDHVEELVFTGHPNEHDKKIGKNITTTIRNRAEEKKRRQQQQQRCREQQNQQSRWERSCYPQMLLQQPYDTPQNDNDNSNYCGVSGTTLFTDILCDEEPPTDPTTTSSSSSSPTTTTTALQQRHQHPNSVEELKLLFQSMDCTSSEDHQFGHDFWDTLEDFLFSFGGGGGCCNYAIQ